MFRYIITLCIIMTFQYNYSFSNSNCKDSIKIINNEVNWGFESKNVRTINSIIIHSTHYVNIDTFSVAGVLAQFNKYNVTSHYLIDREGKIRLLVSEKNIAWHAGKGTLPDGSSNINSKSIGIEIINSPENPPNDKQYEAIAYLVKDIKTRYNIKYILGHDQIAPGRKTDPWLFDWNKFNSLLKD